MDIVREVIDMVGEVMDMVREVIDMVGEVMDNWTWSKKFFA